MYRLSDGTSLNIDLKIIWQKCSIIYCFWLTETSSSRHILSMGDFFTPDIFIFGSHIFFFWQGDWGLIYYWIRMWKERPLKSGEIYEYFVFFKKQNFFIKHVLRVLFCHSQLIFIISYIIHVFVFYFTIKLHATEGA